MQSGSKQAELEDYLIKLFDSFDIVNTRGKYGKYVSDEDESVRLKLNCKHTIELIRSRVNSIITIMINDTEYLQLESLPLLQYVNAQFHYVSNANKDAKIVSCLDKLKSLN